MKLLKSLTAAAAILALTGAAQAALVDLGGGMIYDTTLNITWLQNWNTNGRMNWTAADNWAKNLVYGGFEIGGCRLRSTPTAPAPALQP